MPQGHTPFDVFNCWATKESVLPFSACREGYLKPLKRSIGAFTDMMGGTCLAGHDREITPLEVVKVFIWICDLSGAEPFSNVRTQMHLGAGEKRDFQEDDTKPHQKCRALASISRRYGIGTGSVMRCAMRMPHLSV